MHSTDNPVLILGAGINGAAIARELALNGVAVCLVDQADLASGTTAYSSRLIHGGLRYLEHGELSLVRESLVERKRLLTLARAHVRPLRLVIPVRSRWGGLAGSLGSLLGRPSRRPVSRGVWLVRCGLWLYSWLADDPALRAGASAISAPGVDRQRFPWLCSYHDAQVVYPERLVVAMLTDARAIAAANGTRLDVWTYHRAALEGPVARLESCHERGWSPGTAAADPEQPTVNRVRPAAVINATGAWVDHTLAQLRVPERKLIGGTKGSHFLTYHAGLRAALGDQGVYAEAADGRPIFILPFLEQGVLVGTTDWRFEAAPDEALAADEELDYLLAAVNSVFAGLVLRRDDIHLHYCGVRPLPHVAADSPAAITRRHWLHEHTQAPLPIYSVIGGKLTTARSLAEETAAVVCRKLGRPCRAPASSRERPLPGSTRLPAHDGEWETMLCRVARELNVAPANVRAAAVRFGDQVLEIVAATRDFPAGAASTLLPGTLLPELLARWSVRHEWATRLADLVERRLLLHFEPGFSVATLRRLAELLVEEGRLAPAEVEAAIASQQRRLATRYGLRLT